jgi:DNA repair exonuclease SbcCD ATPase subunit
MSGDPVLPLPEDEELTRLRADLARLEEELADRELDLATKGRELADFQSHYLATVGVRIAELDELEAQIAANLARSEGTPEAEEAAEQAQERARASSAGLEDDPHVGGQSAPERPLSADLKSLFRTVAKAVHPDLAADADDRAAREQSMASANAAYAADDIIALQSVWDEWKRRPQAVVGEGTAAELVRTIRSIAAVKARLAAIDEELSALASGTLASLYQRSLDARSKGRDLLREMADEIGERVQAARERLEAVRIDVNTTSPEGIADHVFSAPSAARGWTHSLVVAESGNLWSWGWNDHGQLGHGDLEARYSPACVEPAHDWVAVAAGAGHSVGLKQDRSLWAWGRNDHGQLGLAGC